MLNEEQESRLHHNYAVVVAGLGNSARRVKEGTSSVGVQSGFSESWWAEAMECHGYLRNVQDQPADGQTPSARVNSPFDGPIIPFGAAMKFDLSKKNKFVGISSAWKSFLEYSWRTL